MSRIDSEREEEETHQYIMETLSDLPEILDES